MENSKKQEELEKMYALRAGLSLISQKCDEVESNITNKIELEKQQKVDNDFLNMMKNKANEEIKETNESLKKYLLLSFIPIVIICFAIILIFFKPELIFLSIVLIVIQLGILLFILIKGKKDYNEEKDQIKTSKMFKEICLDQNIPQMENDLRKKVLSAIKKAEQENPILKQEVFNLTTKLTENYETILDIRDWENLDLVIYYYETGRADSIKEALQLVDKERRNNALIEAIGIATNEICRSIHSLGNVMIAGFNSLSAQLEAQRIQTMGALQQLNNNLSGVITQQTLSNALLAKANVSSKDMVEQMKKLNSK